ncbi:hypothetical protein CTI12_AA226290 [Artemisia annua]|uniref:Uncharacterized protein n=1 Tax=Artemisia annua TaxID=35608 RepID=A0A2U1NQC1_ARTAN|nr:hypothetical protein CTI12_AA226290 [Artemisia annua]
MGNPYFEWHKVSPLINLSMASSLAKVAVSIRSLVLFRPVITSSTRFFNTKRLDDKEDNTPRFIRECPPFINDLVTAANFPHLSATENLESELNLMDDRIGVKERGNGYPRWSVGEQNEGLVILRSMNGLHEDMKECAPTRDMPSLLHLTHFDTPCHRWDVMKEAKELDKFVESTSGMHVLSSMRVFCTMRYIPAIYFVVAHEGPDPEDLYGGYVRKIYLPRRFYNIEDIYVQRNWEVFNITIPKKNYQKAIYKFGGNYIFFREKK